MEETLRQWGRNIAAGRRAAGIKSQQALAEAVGVTQQTVSRWERGDEGPRDHHKVRIAEVLHQDVRQLFPLTRRSAHVDEVAS